MFPNHNNRIIIPALRTYHSVVHIPSILPGVGCYVASHDPQPHMCDLMGDFKSPSGNRPVRIPDGLPEVVKQNANGSAWRKQLWKLTFHSRLVFIRSDATRRSACPRFRQRIGSRHETLGTIRHPFCVWLSRVRLAASQFSVVAHVLSFGMYRFSYWLRL